MSSNTAQSNYNDLLSLLNQKISTEKKRSDLWSLFRLSSFIVFVAIFVLCFNYHWVVPVVVFYVLGYLFIKVVKKHNKISVHYRHLVRQKDVCEKELSSIKVHKAYKSNGIQFRTDKHAYASDLDLFGEKSLYHFINRCQTELGEQQLANRLLNGLPVKDIGPCNQAIKELSKNTDWITAFMSAGNKEETKTFDQKGLTDWKKLDLNWTKNSALKLLTIIMPLITIGVFIYLTVNYSLFYGLLSLLPNGFIVKKYLPVINDIVEKSELSLKTLTQHVLLFKIIEEATFEADLLKEIQSKLSENNIRSSLALSKLSFYIEQLEIKYNLIGSIFNVISLWDFHFMRLLASWKDTHQEEVDSWIWALSEMETLVSLSCLAHNNPSWCYPEIEVQSTSLNITAVGHPLIHPESRVDNDLSMDIEKHIRLITGSNMAGKSTFLRAVGCNIVLANAGSVCCAKVFQLPNLKLYSSMRSNDALQESTSGFYAELKNLKRIIDAVNHQEHCFYLVDEVLKGTNTKDRHLGSKALIQQLIEKPSAGLVSTHDLELASLEKTTEGRVENWCFEVDVDGEQLIFDYKIKRGVSESFNATHLMRNMGIHI